ncbi:acyl-CoA thioesterase II [Acidothermaceae bacterium B102]|nr:acyl-CoA thioesterase II [Acidothermaceae bacterium B102]
MERPASATALSTVINRRSLLDLLKLDQIAPQRFVASYVYPDSAKMFGGQIAAQSLMAAGLTCPVERAPHSFHCYFLRPGDPERPTQYHVEIERDGRRFSSRRVTALQSGRALCHTAASFQDREEGPSSQTSSTLTGAAPEGAPEWVPPRLFSVDGRLDPETASPDRVPSRFWLKCREELPSSPLWNACALAYCGDSTNAVNHFATPTHRASTSLDYAVWFHRASRASQWMFVTLTPQTVAHGRGFYTGTVHQEEGQVVASLAQETLFHARES